MFVKIIISIRLSYTTWWDSNPRHRNDWCLKPGLEQLCGGLEFNMTLVIWSNSVLPALRSQPLQENHSTQQSYHNTHGKKYLFTLRGINYLLVVDYFSQYPEVVKLTNTTSSSVVHVLKSLFSRYGIPETVVSDNGPQYSSQEFAQFARAYNFSHITSSPYFPPEQWDG